MAASYPSAIKSFDQEINDGTLADANDFNAATDEINAIETVLGTNPSRVLERDTTEQTLVSSTTETTVFTFSVPANTLSTDRALRLTLNGLYFNNQGVATTFHLRVKYGSTTVLALDDAPAQSSAERPLLLEAMLAAGNATGAQKAFGKMIMSAANGVVGEDGGFGTMKTAAHDSVSEDSTGALTFVVTAQHTENSANVQFVFTHAFLELV